MGGTALGRCRWLNVCCYTGMDASWERIGRLLLLRRARRAATCIDGSHRDAAGPITWQ